MASAFRLQAKPEYHMQHGLPWLQNSPILTSVALLHVFDATPQQSLFLDSLRTHAFNVLSATGRRRAYVSPFGRYHWLLSGPAPADPPSLPGCKSTASRELCLKGKLVRRSVPVRARVSCSSALTRAQTHLVSGYFQGPALTIHNTNEDLGWESTLLGWTSSLCHASPAR